MDAKQQFKRKLGAMEYASSRSWLGDTPSVETALYLMRNRVDIVEAAASSLDVSNDYADVALCDAIQLLLLLLNNE